LPLFLLNHEVLRATTNDFTSYLRRETVVPTLAASERIVSDPSNQARVEYTTQRLAIQQGSLPMQSRPTFESNLLMDNTIVISDIDEETISNNSCIFDCIAKNTNNIFAKEFFNLKKLEKHELTYFKQPFLKKIFGPVTEKDVFNKIDQIGSNYSWIIIPNTLKSLFTDSKDFVGQDYSDKKIIHNFGKYKDLNVWVNPDQKVQTIYFGKYDSLTLIINKNLKIDDLKCFNDTYQLNKSISVEYLFIENQPISSLTLN
jgi:hypothetical protein